MHPPPRNPNHHVIQVTRQSTSELNLTEIDETEHGPVVRNHRAQSDLLLNHPMWAAVAHGSLEAIKTETEKPTEKGIGPAALSSIIQWIVTTFPTLVNVPYAGKRYFGETALHLAVVQAEDHNPAEHKKSIVRLLIEHEADPNISLATGTEFASIDQGTLRYYGQSVLHFAVVSGKPLIVSIFYDRLSSTKSVVTVYLLTARSLLTPHDKRNIIFDSNGCENKDKDILRIQSLYPLQVQMELYAQYYFSAFTSGAILIGRFFHTCMHATTYIRRPSVVDDLMYFSSNECFRNGMCLIISGDGLWYYGAQCSVIRAAAPFQLEFI
ncbi:hypothetical protein BCR33DRAFT_792522 [Rhizoclosmatium globosum]|uniref:Uncharacterized protein n=1 Tax=Rhizoclosmatium globosum TaxID=329046 RepID=A0A1Y2B7J7_9FUNG|nr:hypothetical protein BCR33DRAFT_792522 [Rhizoclosmatium globosum]|eukprot:ORY30704.1 hypothetical protein BCR33DRAFT_792522 [Rhizoclosmatium globosum]